ncbi:helix-turn-helix domain-containing protein [Actinoalloteichus hymeniacidonis]|nr:XRE family transcriptional regulator [Actinoalloteichus hymeniacidonis]MBB5906959.1 Zn-dependent peptidase ImmA (M78 family)/DNA-binding XRE family transcriptional regulator [Actinoalloteichus hymeniacidonis]
MVTASRISLARRRRGLTAAELARKVGVSAQSVSNYERDRQRPTVATVHGLADALGFPAEFFFRPEVAELPGAAVSFRAPSKLPGRLRGAALGAGQLATEISGWLDIRFALPITGLPSLHRPDPETAAEMVRAEWGLGHAPAPNMVHLLESRGVRVFSVPGECAEVDAFSFWQGERPFVFLSTAKSPERCRFDAAHELGHLVLHAGAPALDGPSAESEANAFAAAFLLPRADVLARVSRGPLVDQVVEYRSRWRVSALALTYRLHDLELLSDWQYRTVCGELSRRGFRRDEPGGVPREGSQLLAKAFRALREHGSGPQEIAAALAIDMEELNSLVFGLVVTAVSTEGTSRMNGAAPDWHPGGTGLRLVP